MLAFLPMRSADNSTCRDPKNRSTPFKEWAGKLEQRVQVWPTDGPFDFEGGHAGAADTKLQE
jgi:hypothetical protein